VSPSAPEPEAAPDLAYYEAVPYLLVVESVERGGEWLRPSTLSFPAASWRPLPPAVEAIEKLELSRRRLLRHLWDRGAPIPVPRPPLRRA